MAKKVQTGTLEEFYHLTDFYDFVQPYIEKAAVGMTKFNAIQKEIVALSDRNSNVLQTNIVGKQFLFNKQTENNIYKIFGINYKELEKIFKDSEYFAYFGDLKLKDQFMFAVPLILFARELGMKNKKKESQFIFLSSFFKPYATVVFKYFGKYDVNEDQMRYTVEQMTDKFDIKREGNLIGAIEKRAESVYNNYMNKFISDKSPITDRDLHVAFNSGIFSSMNNFVKNIYDIYSKNKGKYLSFELSTFEGTDDSEGETFEKDIQSDTQIKNVMVKKAVNIVTKKPVDVKLVDTAARYAFIGTGVSKDDYSYSGYYNDLLRNTLVHISENFFSDMPLLFESIIGSFLYEINPLTKKKNSSRDLRTAVFIKHSIDKFRRSPNNKNTNDLRVRELIEKFVASALGDATFQKSTKNNSLKYAVHFYYTMIVQKG